MVFIPIQMHVTHTIFVLDIWLSMFTALVGYCTTPCQSFVIGEEMYTVRLINNQVEFPLYDLVEVKPTHQLIIHSLQLRLCKLEELPKLPLKPTHRPNKLMRQPCLVLKLQQRPVRQLNVRLLPNHQLNRFTHIRLRTIPFGQTHQKSQQQGHIHFGQLRRQTHQRSQQQRHIQV